MSDHLDPRHRHRDRDDLPAAVTVGKVTRVTADGAYLELRELVRGAEYGPAAYPDVYRAGTVTIGAVLGNDVPHSHTIPGPGVTSADSIGADLPHVHGVIRPLTAGDTVLVAFTDLGAGPEPVILARL